LPRINANGLWGASHQLAYAFVTFRAISAIRARRPISIVPKNSRNGLHALARILPSLRDMSRSTGSAGALIEILNLCAETLTSLHSDHDIAAATQPDHTGVARAGKNTHAGPRLVLIQGGLSTANRGDASR
jgi:hypothetical protein